MMQQARRPMFSRRGWLSLVGAGVSAIPFLSAEQRAIAQSSAGGLTRFIAVYMPHGVAREHWRPRGDFELDFADASLAPFAEPDAAGRSYRDRLLVIEGLDLTAGITGGSAGHDGSRVLLTGSAGNGKGASLDQFLAVDSGLGGNTPLSSLVLGVGNARPEIGYCISYASGGSALPKLIDPSETFHEAFGRWMLSADPAARARAEDERRRGQSALDVIRVDLDGLAQRVGASERWKLDQHASSLREVEKRLQSFELACTPPNAPAAGQFPKHEAFGGGEPYFDAITDLQIDLMAQAFACGVTQFGSLFLAGLDRTQLDPLMPADVHADVAHRYVAPTDASPLVSPNPETSLLLARQNRYCHSKLARLLSRLAELDVLDGTLILAMSDMGDPARHSSRNVPTLLMGDNTVFPLGRYLDVREAGAGVPNNRLLVSIAQAFGLELDSYGEAPDPGVTRGELSGLR